MSILFVLGGCAIGWFVWSDTGSAEFGLLAGVFATLVLGLVVTGRTSDGASGWGIGDAGDACSGD